MILAGHFHAIIEGYLLSESLLYSYQRRASIIEKCAAAFEVYDCKTEIARKRNHVLRCKNLIGTLKFWHLQICDGTVFIIIVMKIDYSLSFL